MEEYVLALNCGSSSLKFTLFIREVNNVLEEVMAGVVEEIGNVSRSRIKSECKGEKTIKNTPITNHEQALDNVFDIFEECGVGKEQIISIGHRVVHGGTKYNRSIKINDDVMATIQQLVPIAPLHNPPNIIGIEVAKRVLEDVPQVAVFDTAFHGSLPEYAFRYAIPEEWYKEFGVRTYGFHGTSHMYVSKRCAKIMGQDYNSFSCITAHLGNGCSIDKIVNGQSVDTSMGFTPLEGVIMGTRSGDIDPAIIAHVSESLMVKENISHDMAFEKVMNALNKESGLKALADTNMMQDIRVKALEGDLEAELVISIYAYKIAKYIGAYWATMNDCKAIVFTAGLGENEGYVRKKILEFLPALNFVVDDENNSVRKEEIIIGRSDKGDIDVFVIPTDEEIVIGYDALYLGAMNEKLPSKYPFEEDQVIENV